MPKVTVLMPVFNAELYLKQAITSILNQTFKDFEFLIINDGSSDNSVEIIKSFNDSRIRLVHNEKNLGLVKSLNKGIELAKCEYIARMDADDIAHEERLSMQMEFLDSNKDIDICGSILEEIDTGKIYNYELNHNDIVVEMLFRSPLGHPSVVFRKEIFNKYNLYYKENCYAEDYQLWFDYKDYIKLANVQKVLLKYRVHNSKTRFSILNNEKQAQHSDYIRLSFLEELGIVPTFEEFEIHKSLSVKTYLPDNKYRIETENWLNKIIRGFKQYKRSYLFSMEKCKNKIMSELDDVLNTYKVTVNELENTSDIYIWGTGTQANIDYAYFSSSGLNISGFIDSNKEKWGTMFNELKVISPEQYIENNLINSYIIISSMFYKEIINDAIQMGLSEDKFKYIRRSY